jgi:hypothetical protein
VTVHRRAAAQTFDGVTERRTSVHPGVYPLRSHYWKRDGLEVAWIDVVGHTHWVSLALEPGEARTWDVSPGAPSRDYRHDR